MSAQINLPEQQPHATVDREEVWSLDCVSCAVTVSAESRRTLAAAVRDDHDRCHTAQRVSVRYAVTTEASRQHSGSRPHVMWLALPATLLAHEGGSHGDPHRLARLEAVDDVR